MAEATLSNDLTDIRLEVSIFLGWPDSYAQWSDKQKSHFKQVILKKGYKRFLNPSFRGQPYQWSFMIPLETLDTVAPFSATMNEVQTITITGTPTGGTFTLAVDDNSTVSTTPATINYNDTATAVNTALIALDNVTSGDVSVTGGPLPDKVIVVEFTSGMKLTNFPLMTVASSLTGGTAPAVAVTETRKGAAAATLTIASGIVTKAAGDSGQGWPTDAADYELIIAGVAYIVASRTSDDVLVLDDTSTNITDDSRFSLVVSQYVLPDDFGGMEAPFTYRTGNDAYFGPIEQISDSQIRTKQQFTLYTNRPTHFSMAPVNLSVTTGQRHSIRFWPVPDAVYRLHYQYRRNPDVPTGTNDFFWGGASMSEAFTACVLAEAEMYDQQQQGPFHAQCLDAMDRAILRDRSDNRADFLGNNTDNSDEQDFTDNAEPSWPFGGAPTYEGH